MGQYFVFLIFTQQYKQLLLTDCRWRYNRFVSTACQAWKTGCGLFDGFIVRNYHVLISWNKMKYTKVYMGVKDALAGLNGPNTEYVVKC